MNGDRFKFAGFERGTQFLPARGRYSLVLLCTIVLTSCQLPFYMVYVGCRTVTCFNNGRRVVDH